MLSARPPKLIITGNVFEKRLIEAYISENGKDPVTNEDLTVSDLVELKSPQIARPRPPTLTSIPSLLSVFQNEWDALALETYTLRQHLTQTRQELSRALYEHDAAVRVITRLSKERDEAREALSRISINGSAASNGDAMQVDGQDLPEGLIAKVEATQEKCAIDIFNSRRAVANFASQIVKDPTKARSAGRLGYSGTHPKLYTHPYLEVIFPRSSYCLTGPERRSSPLWRQRWQCRCIFGFSKQAGARTSSR